MELRGDAALNLSIAGCSSSRRWLESSCNGTVNSCLPIKHLAVTEDSNYVTPGLCFCSSVGLSSEEMVF